MTLVVAAVVGALAGYLVLQLMAAAPASAGSGRGGGFWVRLGRRFAPSESPVAAGPGASDPEETRLRRAGLARVWRGGAFRGLRRSTSLGAAIIFGVGAAAVVGAPGVAMAAVVVGGAAGYVAPGIWLRHRANRRHLALRQAVPDAVDLMVLSVDAGLGPLPALERVARALEGVTPLGAELKRTALEARGGRPPEEALRELADRTGVEELQVLGELLAHAHRLGGSVADALWRYADELRLRRMQRAEEQAARTAIKLLFPLVFLVLPATFVVVLGPLLIRALQMLQGGG